MVKCLSNTFPSAGMFLGICAITFLQGGYWGVWKYKEEPSISLWLVLLYNVLRTSLPFVCGQEFKKCVVFHFVLGFFFKSSTLKEKKNGDMLSIAVCNWKCQRLREFSEVWIFFLLIHWFPLALHLFLQFSSLPGLLAHVMDDCSYPS